MYLKKISGVVSFTQPRESQSETIEQIRKYEPEIAAKIDKIFDKIQQLKDHV